MSGLNLYKSLRGICICSGPWPVARRILWYTPAMHMCPGPRSCLASSEPEVRVKSIDRRQT